MNTQIIKKSIFLTISIVLFLNTSAQTKADNIYYKRLYYLCKAWGHAKYYHTEIAKGLVNWDDELLTTIEEVGNATSNSEYNVIVETMLASAGKMGISTANLPNFPDSLNNNADLNWIRDTFFSETVSALLDYVAQEFRPQSNIYVDEAWAGGNPVFEVDDLYNSGLDYPNEKLRILAIFRYWNIINYFYPYKNIMDQQWDTTLVEFIPKIVDANDAVSFHLAFKELTTRLNDSHTHYSSNSYWDWHGNYHTPFLVRFVENETVITKVVEGNTSISIGDIVKEIDGHDIYKLRDSLRKYAHGSNDVSIERTLNSFIQWGDSGLFQIKLDNGSEVYTTTLTRKYENYDILSSNYQQAWQTVENSCSVGIVDMGQLKKEQVTPMFRELWDTEAIIFDIRNYPNGTLWTIVDYLYPMSINIANFTLPDITYPGRLSWMKATIGNGTTDPYPGEIVILFDERTQSHAEYTCMALEQFPGTTKIGSTTSGADGNVAKIYLPGNIITYATFLGTFYPDYTATQRVGIIPDFEVNPTIVGRRNGIDEVMEYALNHLNCDITRVLDSDLTSENGSKILLFPNPVLDCFQYEFLQDNTSNTILFEIYDLQGRKVKTEEKETLSGEIDISELVNGVYFIRVKSKGNIVTKKIIKN